MAGDLERSQANPNPKLRLIVDQSERIEKSTGKLELAAGVNEKGAVNKVFSTVSNTDGQRDSPRGSAEKSLKYDHIES